MQSLGVAHQPAVARTISNHALVFTARRRSVPLAVNLYSYRVPSSNLRKRLLVVLDFVNLKAPSCPGQWYVLSPFRTSSFRTLAGAPRVAPSPARRCLAAC